MSYQIVQELVDQLEDENPNRRIRAIRHLAALGDPTAIPQLSNVYLSEDELPHVKRAAGEALGVFQAIKEALEQNKDVELPDPKTVKPPRFTPEFLRQLLTWLTVLMILLWVVDAALYMLPRLNIGALSGPPAPANTLIDQFRARHARVFEDASNQQQAWQQLQATGALDCSIPAPNPASTDSSDLKAQQIDFATQPELHQANLALITAIDELTLVANNWLVGCGTGTVPIPADEGLRLLDEVMASLSEAQGWLDQAAASAASGEQPTQAPPTTEGGQVPTVPSTPGPAQPTITPQVPPTAPPSGIDIRPYVLGMRERVDYILRGRGIVPQLQQYWADIRTGGQSYGCRQVLPTDGLEEYTFITPEIAAVEPRLQIIADTLNIGLTLTRQSLTAFQQGCASGNFAAVLNTGQQQIQQAAVALEQVSTWLDELQAELNARQ